MSYPYMDMWASMKFNGRNGQGYTEPYMDMWASMKF